MPSPFQLESSDTSLPLPMHEKTVVLSELPLHGEPETAASTPPSFFQLSDSSFDIRDYFPLAIVLLIASPLSVSLISYRTCLLILALYHGIPPLIRLRYPTFMRVDILEDLRIRAGASLSLFASITALLLQAHNTSISLAVKFHSEFYSRPLTRLLRTYLYVEMALNGSSEEKEQTASWLRWMHRHIHGSITPEVQQQLGIPDDVDHYGYIEELKAYIMETLTWSTISFQTRFGRKLSKRAKDTIVLEYTCAGLRLGVPQSLLTKDYDSFVISFNHRLDRLDSGYELTRSIVDSVESSVLGAKKSWVTSILVRLALLVGETLLPERVKTRYQLSILRSRSARILQSVLCGTLWLIYPFLMWIPLRGMICLLLVLEPQLRPTFNSSLQAIHSMDILNDKPLYAKAKSEGSNNESPSEIPAYTQWLGVGKEHPPLLQIILVRTLEAQLSPNQMKAWLSYPGRVAAAVWDAASRSLRHSLQSHSAQLLESRLFHSGDEIKLPVHIGFVMDGNRRYARQRGQPVIEGHIKGAATASNILEWWLRYLPNTASYDKPGYPKYLTCWAFSSDNYKRSEEELEGLFRIMASEFKSLAFTSLIHLFRIRVRIIGSERHLLPMELLDMIDMLEETTSMYDNLFLQIAVGYGGRQEVVQSIQRLLEQGKPVTEQNIGAETHCAKIQVPPCDLIVRTSERRTSGFFLWDTQGAELHFIDKLWPELTERDWLDVLKSFSTREMRWGQ